MEVTGKVDFKVEEIIVNWLNAGQKLRKMVNSPVGSVIDVLRKLLVFLINVLRVLNFHSSTKMCKNYILKLLVYL